MKCLITGGAGGLGKCLAEIFFKNGFDIVIADIDKNKLNQIKKNMDCEIYKVNLLNDSEINRFLNEIKMVHSDLDIIINNAGIGFSNYFHQNSVFDDEKMIDLNCKTIVKISKVAVEIFEKNKNNNCYLINIASSVSFLPLPYMSVYAATKSFILSFSEGIREEYKNKFKTLTICPSGIDTSFQDLAGVKKTANNNLLSPLYVSEKIFKYVKRKDSGVKKIGFNSYALAILSSIIPLRYLTFISGILYASLRKKDDL